MVTEINKNCNQYNMDKGSAGQGKPKYISGLFMQKSYVFAPPMDVDDEEDGQKVSTKF